MKISIRNEEKKDYKIVENIAREAFWNLYFPGAHEHYVVHRMRNHTDFIKELSFVVEVDEKVVGAIFYTHSNIIQKDGSNFKTISFGPVFIHPDYHRKGIGRKLITHSINKAKELGFKVITTLGYPYHYKPYVFLGGKNYNISMPDMKFYTGLLVLPLQEDALKNISGYAIFSDVLEVNPEEVEEFDKSFPFKEKKIQESQREFEIACCEIDN